MLQVDTLILEFDHALRTLTGQARAHRPTPSAGLSEPDLDKAEQGHSARLMRVNHAGEVSAQALYRGQALAAEEMSLRKSLSTAAQEELDHLSWTRERISELGGRTSALNPFWYGASFVMGYTVGRLGSKWSLGFLEETEKQVERHLEDHGRRLPVADTKSAAILSVMKIEEAQHAAHAKSLGAASVPPPAAFAMGLFSRLLTRGSYWL